MTMRYLLLLALLGHTLAFRVGKIPHFAKRNLQQFKVCMSNVETENMYHEKNAVLQAEQHQSNANSFTFDPITLVAILPVVAMFFEPALADANEYGILAGRTASLLHPITNFALFATSIYSAVLGLQWRRLRGISEEIKALNSELPKLKTGTAKFPLESTIEELTAQLSSLDATTADAQISAIKQDITSLQSASAVNEKYLELTKTRKELQAANLKDKHHLTGSILLGVGVSVSILGALNTYFRAGRLFPGPHLYAGIAITILWAVAASLVPAMQKGNETARIAHIGLNVINVLLFAYQIPTGIEILLKVWEKTSWP